VRVRDTAAFTVVDAPPQPLDLYETALRLPPLLSTGPYVQTGAEYGIVVSGRIKRGDGARARAIEQGESFVSSVGFASESRASRGAVQISAFLEPRGVMPAAVRASVIFRRRFAVAAVPPTPFTLAEQLVDIQSGGSTIRFSYGGRAYCTVAGGELTLEKDGVLSRYRLGESFVAAPGEIVRFANAGKGLSSVQVVVLLPEAVHLTRPVRAY
jgi:quercetin dioxygenase-like cupin family protein